jgi:hypothetical protein
MVVTLKTSIPSRSDACDDVHGNDKVDNRGRPEERSDGGRPFT